jgi:hypothetical protein
LIIPTKQLTVLKELTVFWLQVNVPVCISGVSSAAAADVIKEFTDKVSKKATKRKKMNFLKVIGKKVQNVLREAIYSRLRMIQCSEKDKT